MSDEQKPPEPTAPAPSTSSGGGDAEPGPVPYARFKEINDKAKSLEERLSAIEAAQKSETDKKLAEEKKWEELAAKRETELKTERAARLRLQVALAAHLPPDLADRLQGDDEAALVADAARLLQFVKPQEGPGVPPAGQGGKPPKLNINNMTPAQIRENAGALLKQGA